MSLSSPTVEETGQESGSQLCGNFQMLIVSAVKICKQCLQTASAFGGLRPPIHAPEPYWEASVPHKGLPGIQLPQMKIPVAANE